MKTLRILALSVPLLFLPGLAFAQGTGVACTMQYAPVCGAQQVQCVAAPCYPVYHTYGNACVLGAEGGTFIHDGECTADETGPVVPMEGNMNDSDVPLDTPVVVDTDDGELTPVTEPARDIDADIGFFQGIIDRILSWLNWF
ncbi:MAG TPA: hypothetical protein VHO23_02750 [Candidatus Paceibacterota bacterium]|nr:hypothetical protein [Candidatus Paceibacterota bacterium]